MEALCGLEGSGGGDCAGKQFLYQECGKGEKIIREGDVVEEVAFIISGVLKAVYIDQYGKEKVYCFGYIPGEAAISVTHLGTGIKSICTVEAISESVVLCVPMTCLIKLTKDNLDVARIYNKMLSMSLKK